MSQNIIFFTVNQNIFEYLFYYNKPVYIFLFIYEFIFIYSIIIYIFCIMVQGQNMILYYGN